jgi:flagellar hook-basal body complex protein FliE
MSIDAIQPLGAISGTTGIGDLTNLSTNTTGGSGGGDFGAMVTQGLQKLQDAQNVADDLAVQAATGTLTDVHDYMIAATQASLATSLTVAVRNKALDAFNEIMRMQA